MKNAIHLNISPEDLAEIGQAIVVIKTKLLPHLVNLNQDDKQVLPKMGDKTIAFVQKGLMHMEQNPDLVPKYTNIEDLKVDLAAVETLRNMLLPLNQFSDMLNDSLMLSGSEAYIAVLAFYNFVKGAAKSNVPGADVIYNDLKVRFPGGRKSSGN